jgi:L-amino acid N-acyltransferase YncA
MKGADDADKPRGPPLGGGRARPHFGAMNIRMSEPGDLPAIAAIYGHWVTHGLASFELEPPPLEEMAKRREAVLAGGYPYLVAEREGEVLGYAYAGPYRTRPAYRFTVENSIYVSPTAHRGGVASALLARLIEECTARGFRLMVAVIGDSGNAASIGLHRAQGFGMVGTIPAIGWKHGRWVDSVLMSLSLGEGPTTHP